MMQPLFHVHPVVGLPEDAAPARLPAELGALPETPLEDGVAQTIKLFKAALAEGRLAPSS